MSENKISLKEKLKKGEMVFGTWNSIPSASVVDAIGCSGIDFIVIDAEHGPVSMETAEDLVRTAQLNNLSPIIRVPTNSPHLILRALDIGACGVQVPHISTLHQAQQVVKSSKYYPEGDRGFSPFTRAGRYGMGFEGGAKRSNENTLVVINIEGQEGLKNLKDIVNVHGIDVIFIGPYDLSQSLGKPGKVDDPDVIEAIRKSASLVKEKGLVCGSFAGDVRYLDILIDCGVQYITYMVDSYVISKTYKDYYDLFSKRRQGLK